MNVKQVPPLPQASGPTDPGILDLEHLRRYTLLDQGLERELLTLFREQATLQFDTAMSAADAAVFKLALHTLKGTARSIGATAVAKASEAVEHLKSDHIAVRSAIEMADLKRAIDAADRVIAELLA